MWFALYVPPVLSVVEQHGVFKVDLTKILCAGLHSAKTWWSLADRVSISQKIRGCRDYSQSSWAEIIIFSAVSPLSCLQAAAKLQTERVSPVFLVPL